MLTITIVSLFTLYQSSNAQWPPCTGGILGPNGQCCLITSENQCEFNMISFQPLLDPEEIECDHEYECCLCSSITCGIPSDGTSTGGGCEQFKADGLNSASYVNPILIYGKTDDGAKVECEGESSCEGSTIIGTFIKEFKCTDRRACTDTNVTLSFINDNDAKVQCGGISSCYNSNITVTGVEKIQCTNQFGCQNAKFTIINPQEEFEFECQGASACAGAEITIILTTANEVDEFTGFKCESESACAGASFTIINEGSLAVKFEELECEGNLACSNSVWNVIESITGGVIFDECDCDIGDNVCSGAVQILGGTPIGCFPLVTTTTTIPINALPNVITTTATTPTLSNVIPKFTTTITPVNALPNVIATTTTATTTTTPINALPNVIAKPNLVATVDPCIGGILGPNGQCCGIIGQSDNLCPMIGGGFTSLFDAEEIECEDSYSCCLCQSITCGIIGIGGCEELQIDGSNAAFYVNPIGVYGDIGEGAEIECEGPSSCEGTTIDGTRVKAFKCEDSGSCRNAVVTITDPIDELEIQCEGPFSCEGLNLKIIIPFGSTVTEIGKIQCSGIGSCQNANIIIINQGLTPIIVEELDCGDSAACVGTTFDLIGNILFEECKCGAGSSCLDIIGIESCFANLDQLECRNTACAGTNMVITNPSNDFELKCENVGSCTDFHLTIIFNDAHPDGPIDEIEGIKCSQSASCFGLIFTILNQQTNNQIIKVDSIDCEGNSACYGAIFSGGGIGNVIFDEIECDNDACGIIGQASQCLAERGGINIWCGSDVFN